MSNLGHLNNYRRARHPGLIAPGIYQGGNCTLWVDASQERLANNNPVLIWADRNGNLQSSPITREYKTGPLFKTGISNGMPGVYFNGSSNGFLLDPARIFPNNEDFTVFAVHKPAATTATRTVIDAGIGGTGADSRIFMRVENSNGFYARAGIPVDSGDIATETYTANTVHLHVIEGYSGTFYSTIDGGTRRSAAFDNGTASAASIGFFTSGTTQFYLGYIHEILIFYPHMDITNSSILTTHLKNKWGI